LSQSDETAQGVWANKTTMLSLPVTWNLLPQIVEMCAIYSHF